MVLGAMVLTVTTAAAQSLEQKIRTMATAPVTWVGYRVPMVAGPRQMCCYDMITDGNVLSGGTCRLESGSGVSMNTGGSFSPRRGRLMVEIPTEIVRLARMEDRR